MKLFSIRGSDLLLAALVVSFVSCLSVEGRSTRDVESKYEKETDDGADLALADGADGADLALADGADETLADGLDDDELDDGKGDSGENDDDADAGPAPTMKSVSRNFTVAAGDTVWLPCEVTNPTQVVLMWTKDGRLLYQGKLDAISDNRIKLETNDSLRISDVKPEDEGVYICKMMDGSKNPPEIHHTIRLLKAPAIVEMRPKGNERLVLAGKSLEIFCIVTGFPTPTLNWAKNGLRLMSNSVEFRKQSIFIRHVHHSHSGMYQCLAANGVGIPAHDAVDIKVLHKPEVNFVRELINSDVGVEAILSCKTTSEPLPNIKWLKDSQTISNTGNFRINHQPPNSTLVIRSVRPIDFGTYTCEAENEYGTHRRSVKLVREPVLIEQLNGDGPALRWTFHSHQPLRQVEIMYRRMDDGPESKWTIIHPAVLEQPSPKYIARHDLVDLPAGQYIAKVKASNEHGWSVTSNEYIFNADIEDNEVGPEDQIYQAPRESTDKNNSATDLSSSIILPLLTICLFYRIL